MPELPEVETVCRGLNRRLPGHTVQAVKVLRQDSIGYPEPRDFSSKLKGHVFKQARRRGKYILIDLSNDAGLAVHLRMSGRLLLVDKDWEKGNFLRVNILLDKERELRFEDMRVFGRLWYVPKGMSFEDVIPTLAELGAEPLEGLAPQLLKDLFAGRKLAVKAALLDQRLIAGIGNIYADEALFLAGVNPLKPAGAVTRSELACLSEVIPKVLNRAIDLGGSTLRDYVDSEGVNGNYQDDSWVYGRKGKGCKICGKQIETAKIAGRTAHFCPQCQARSRRT